MVFHLSLPYGTLFLIAWLILLFIGAIAMPSGTHVAESTNAWRWVIWYLTLVVGIAGLLLSTFGCLGLFIKRAADKSLSLYTVSADYFNLSFILAILLSGLLSWCLFDPTFTAARGFVRSLITCSPIGNMNALMIISVVLFSLFLIYMPFTHMTHAFTKYFTYHRVCWADEPNLRGTEVAKKVREVLEQPVSWSAPHVQPGKKWREIVSEGTETK